MTSLYNKKKQTKQKQRRKRGLPVRGKILFVNEEVRGKQVLKSTEKDEIWRKVTEEYGALRHLGMSRLEEEDESLFGCGVTYVAVRFQGL